MKFFFAATIYISIPETRSSFVAVTRDSVCSSRSLRRGAGRVLSPLLVPFYERVVRKRGDRYIHKMIARTRAFGLYLLPCARALARAFAIKGYARSKGLRCISGVVTTGKRGSIKTRARTREFAIMPRIVCFCGLLMRSPRNIYNDPTVERAAPIFRRWFANKHAV